MTKQISKAEAKRLMAAEKQRLEATTTAAPHLKPAFERILTTFTPRKMSEQRWKQLGDFARDLMRRCTHVTSERTFRQLISELCLFLDWAVGQGVQPTLTDTMRHSLIDQWVAQEGKDNSTWGNRQSRLRSLARHVNPGPTAPRRPAPFTRTAIKDPYTQRDTAALERLANNQPTPTSRRQISAMVGLGLGAGLGPEDLRELCPKHIRRDQDGVLWVEVLGTRPRRVPVRDRYAGLVEAGVRGLKPDDLVLGRKSDRTNVTSGVVGNAAIGSTTVVPDQARMRSTWLLVLMTSPVPLADVLAAAGISTARTLSDLLPFAADPAYVPVAHPGGGHVHAQ